MIRTTAVVVALVAVLTTPTTALGKPSQLPSSPRAAIMAIAGTPNGSWTAYHHDDAHTGNDPAAPMVGSVAPTPGWTETMLDAEVYAEPLIYNGSVFAATLNNSVYALNQSDGTVAWHVDLGSATGLGPPESTGWTCGNVSPQGILGTPIIDVGANRIYVAALFAVDNIYRVIGLDLATGAIVLQTQIPTSIGTGFNWKIQQQRGALALRNGYIYVPFGGRLGDCGGYHGFVVGVPTNGSTTLAVYQTPSTGSGIWGAGGVVVDDNTGNVFATTGNGVAGGCGAVDQNDAVVRLSPALALQDWFMPMDWQANWCSNDQDLGSAGPLLISPNLLFQSGKWGAGFLLNPNSLGHVDGQLFPTPKPATYAEANTCFGNHLDATFGSFAYAAPFVYLECEGGGLVALNVNTATQSFSPCDAGCATPNWHVGSGTFGPPIVAGGAVWAANDGGGLYAFNATTGAQIYHSAGFGINRFVTPAEAGGQVFVPSHTVIKSFTFAPPPAPPPPAAYTAVTSVRLLDTRTAGGPLGPMATRNLTVAGVGVVPAGATAVVVNVTVTNTAAPSFLTVYPAGATRPYASNLNWVPGETIPNLVSVQIGSGGAITFFNNAGMTDVVVDLEGYYAAPSGTAGGEVALTPARITDTRTGSGLPNAGNTLGPAGIINVQVTGAGGVPATGVSAAILNVTVTNTTGSSFLTVWPAGAPRPTASNLNWVTGVTIPNRVIVPIGAGGQVSIFNSVGSVDVIVDVSAYFTDATAAGKLFTPHSPIRLADTRISGGTLGAGSTLTLQVTGPAGVRSGATAVVLNVTVTNTTNSSFLTVYPSTGLRPLASDLNWVSGDTIPNMVVATLGTTGAITIFNNAGSTDVIVDIAGRYS